MKFARMTLKNKIKEIIEVASQIRLAIDELEHLMDDEVMGWVESKQDTWPDEWALEIVNLKNSIVDYAQHIPSLTDDLKNTVVSPTQGINNNIL